MKNLVRAVIRLIILLCLVLPVLAQDQSSFFDYGKMDADTYVNKYFNCSMVLPLDWEVITRADIEQMLSVEQESLEAAHQAKTVMPSEIKYAQLLSAFQHKPDPSIIFNPSIIIMAENLHLSPSIMPIEDFLCQTMESLIAMDPSYDILSDATTLNINGTEFHHVHGEMEGMNAKINQLFYFTKVKDFSFSVILSYVSEDQREVLLQSLQTLRFASNK